MSTTLTKSLPPWWALLALCPVVCAENTPSGVGDISGELWVQVAFVFLGILLLLLLVRIVQNFVDCGFAWRTTEETAPRDVEVEVAKH